MLLADNFKSPYMSVLPSDSSMRCSPAWYMKSQNNYIDVNKELEDTSMNKWIFDGHNIRFCLKKYNFEKESQNI